MEASFSFSVFGEITVYLTITDILGQRTPHAVTKINPEGKLNFDSFFDFREEEQSL